MNLVPEGLRKGGGVLHYNIVDESRCQHTHPDTRRPTYGNISHYNSHIYVNILIRLNKVSHYNIKINLSVNILGRVLEGLRNGLYHIVTLLYISVNILSLIYHIIKYT